MKKEGYKKTRSVKKRTPLKLRNENKKSKESSCK